VANQITDNRTLVTAADSVTGFVDLGGTANGTLDTEIFIQGTGSVGESLGSTLGGILFDMAATPFGANEVVYLWINCGIVGLLDTKANGGFRIRFTGATVSDWFEVYVAGSDDWPPSVQGGWTQFVVDVTEARATAVANGWTNGTPPAVTAVQRVGWAGITGGTMPRMVDNTWLDAIWRLPANTPGIIIEGRNGGSTDWDWADVLTQVGDAAGIIKLTTGGAYALNTPVQFGINDTSTHGFTDTNVTLLWENQEFLPDDFYGLSAAGNAGGTTNVTAGIKTGTGDDATGAQGWTVQAAATGATWAMDFSDPNLDLIGLYGCSFVHGGAFLLDDPSVSVISSAYLDCVSALVSNSEQLRVAVVNAATADGVAFMTTDDLSDIVFSSFEFSDGHGVELTTPRVATQTSKGVSFSGYGADGTTDAAIYNNTGGAVSINLTDGSDSVSTTIRNGAGASTTEVLTTTLEITGLANPSEIRVYDTGTTTEVAGQENVTTGTFTANIDAATYPAVDIAILNVTGFQNRRLVNFDMTTDQSIPASQVTDRQYDNP
jgi:hypothetical protein